MKQWTKEQEIALINQTQDEYVQELIDILNSNDPSVRALEEVNFTSPTGTGKTKMMAKIINRMPNDYFIVTTLSKGQLHKQVSKAIEEDCTGQNFRVYGVQRYTKNSILQDDDILAEIKALPSDARVFWFRYEGHIKSNKWMKLLQKRCDKIINWSATNHDAFGVKCNFTHTMMLRTVQQSPGDIDMALDKLVEIKKQHRCIQGYNPCAVIRLTSTALLETVAKACKKRKLSYISLLQNDDYDMSELCEDDCSYDVIINQQKIVEGIDIRRAHVLWMENEPAKAATTIQMIGRCRRNALLWRDDIDICAPENQTLLEQTRQCFAFYNEKNMKIDEDENGELAQEFCPIISVEKLKAGSTIRVTGGTMSNGLIVAELEGCTGEYHIEKDQDTGFNIVNNPNCYAPRCCVENVCTHFGFNETLEEPFYVINAINSLLKQNPEWVELAYHEIHQYICNDVFLPRTYEWRGNELLCITRECVLTETGVFLSKTEVVNPDDFPIVCDALQNASRCHSHKRCGWLRQNKVITIPIKMHDTYIHLYCAELDAIYQHKCFRLEDLDIRRFRDTEYEPQVAEYNNKVLAQLGIDEYELRKITHYVRNGGNEYFWAPSVAITKRVDRHSKLKRFLINYYSKEYTEAMDQTFSQKIKFDFPSAANRALGFIVEHYAKSLVYGDSYLEPYYTKADEEYFNGSYKYDPSGKRRYFAKHPNCQDAIRIRACLMKYRDEIKKAYQLSSARFLPAFQARKLCEKQYESFIDAVRKYGQQTAEFLRQYITADDQIFSPFITTNSLTGLMDVVNEHTIIDIKCTGSITEKMILQVLAYAYLSQYIGNLNIKRAIVYDAFSGRHIFIPIKPIIKCDKIMHAQAIITEKWKQAKQLPANHEPSYEERFPWIPTQYQEALHKMCALKPAIQDYVLTSLKNTNYTQMLTQCQIPSLKQTYSSATELYEDLFIARHPKCTFNEQMKSNLGIVLHSQVPSYLYFTNTQPSPLQIAVLQAMNECIPASQISQDIATNLPRHFEQYTELLSRFQNEVKLQNIFLPAIHIQTFPVTACCDYWDDQYVKSQMCCVQEIIAPS